MKNNSTILLIVLLLSFSQVESQQLKTKGFIQNNGTIIMKNTQLNQTGGRIENENGHIIVDAPTTVFSQDTLLGRIDYILGFNGLLQYVPQMFYWDVRMSGTSMKMMSDTTKNLTSLERFYSTTEAFLDYDPRVRINAMGYVNHDGTINNGKTRGNFSLIGIDSSQDIEGHGYFKDLDLDNFKGADVINSGGFRVNKTLELKKGEFRNSDTNNFTMMDNSTIIRHSGSSIRSAPIFEPSVNVQYLGDSAMDIGPEIPVDTTILADLRVENVGGITLTRNATANRDIVVSSVIRTERDTNELYVLTSTAVQDPQYLNANAEIIGSFRRTNLHFDNIKMLYNNRYTYILFGNQADANGITELTLRVRPKILPPNGDIDTKVIRDFFISAKDVNYAPVDNTNKMEFGYGWRHAPGNPGLDETGNLNLPDLMLQRWQGNDWEDNLTSQVPSLDDPNDWAFSAATAVTALGQFAIGISAKGQLFIYATAYLEGAYRWGSMATDLRTRGLIPDTPPDLYPHNIDPNRNIVRFDSIPTNAVDWVLVELMDVDSTDKKFYRHCMLLSDGTIVDSNLRNIKIPESGQYSITLKHRNHLAVMTKDTIKIYPTKDPQLVDFTDITKVYSGATALKPLLDKDGQKLWALFAGDINGDGYINEQDDGTDLLDDNTIWDNRNIEGYFPWDITLSGIIHTRDLNMSWNNRGKFSKLIQ